MRYAHIETEESKEHRAEMMLKSEQFRNASEKVRAELRQSILSAPLGVVLNLIEATPEFVQSQPGLFIEADLEKDPAHPAEIGGVYHPTRGFLPPSAPDEIRTK